MLRTIFKFILPLLAAILATAFITWLFQVINSASNSDDIYRSLFNLFVVFYFGQVTAILYKRVSKDNEK